MDFVKYIGGGGRGQTKILGDGKTKILREGKVIISDESRGSSKLLGDASGPPPKSTPMTMGKMEA